jgi:hypothetical protein
MASHGLQPWCAAKKCPVTPEQCLGYINENGQNRTAQNFVACCKIQCGQSANHGLVALECGGATAATAGGTIAYVLLLLLFGGCIVALGPVRRCKNVTFWIITLGSLLFTTGTGVFVTIVTSPFMVLQSVPALGAMNVAVFSYFYSGFRYAVGLGYEGAPLVVFVATSYTLRKALVESTPEDGPIHTGNKLAVAMLVFTLLWIVHSISFRRYGYRVVWRLGDKRRPNGHARNNQNQDDHPSQDPRFLLGAAQGHPTWRTPMGQSTSVVMTALAWSMVRVVKQDLALQECRPDWVFKAMLYGAPILITVTIPWNVLSGTRCRTISGQTVPVVHEDIPESLRSRARRFGLWLGLSTSILDNIGLGAYRAHTFKSEYPGLQSYKDLKDSFMSGETTNYVLNEYVQAAALQRMERNTLFVEDVPDNRLEWSDKVIGCIAWGLAQGGLLISSPGFFSLMLLAEFLVWFFELFDLKVPVVTEVTDSDRVSAVKVVEQCYVGADLGRNELTRYDTIFDVLNDRQNHRSINLHTLLDNTGPCELYNILTQPGLRAPSGSF